MGGRGSGRGGGGGGGGGTRPWEEDAGEVLAEVEHGRERMMPDDAENLLKY